MVFTGMVILSRRHDPANDAPKGCGCRHCVGQGPMRNASTIAASLFHQPAFGTESAAVAGHQHVAGEEKNTPCRDRQPDNQREFGWQPTHSGSCSPGETQIHAAATTARWIHELFPIEHRASRAVQCPLPESETGGAWISPPEPDAAAC